MKYQYLGTVKVFNGRYWKEHQVRLNATKMHLAAAHSITEVLKTHYKGRRITELSVTLQRLGPVMVVCSSEHDENSGE